MLRVSKKIAAADAAQTEVCIGFVMEPGESLLACWLFGAGSRGRGGGLDGGRICGGHRCRGVDALGFEFVAVVLNVVLELYSHGADEGLA